MNHELTQLQTTALNKESTWATKTSPWKIFFGVILVFTSTSGHAKENYASIIIDDLGYNLAMGQRFVELPAELTYSILPHTDHAHKIARLAHKANKEVMLHLPLQSVANTRDSKGTLDLHMTQDTFSATLRKNLESLPHISGVNNHMGSLLTRHPGHMDWLMSILATRGGLYFVDSRTTKQSVAYKTAIAHGVPALKRDVFIDGSSDIKHIDHEFKRFIALVKSRGYGIAIAHPRPNTLHYLKDRLADLIQQGIQIVPVSRLLRITGRQHYVACTNPACTGL